MSTTFLRRFVYLIVDGQRPGTWDLHRINMPRFFNPRSPPIGSAQAMVDAAARLPRPAMTFYAPSPDSHEQRGGGRKDFILIGRDKVLATDHTGRATIYDAGLGAMRTASTLAKPKHRRSAVTVPVGDEKLLVLGSTRGTMAGGGEEEHCFEALAYEHVRSADGECYDDWRCHPLPPPPYRPADIVRAHAVVHGSELWVSTEEENGGGGTYSFDVGRVSWAKQGDWTLPFRGRAEYVPDLKLWFGISSSEDGNSFCALDLAASRRRHSGPALRDVWEDLCPPKGWTPLTCFVVHLGSGRFCVTRFFRDTGGKMLAVFAGVEVVTYGRTGKLLRMVKHKSECYSLGDNLVLNHDDEEVLRSEEPAELEMGLSNIIVVDNLPVVPTEEFEKLENVIRKIYSQIGVIKENGLWMPVNWETKKTHGYCFIEYIIPLRKLSWLGKKPMGTNSTSLTSL